MSFRSSRVVTENWPHSNCFLWGYKTPKCTQKSLYHGWFTRKFLQMFGVAIFSKNWWTGASENSNSLYLEHQWTPLDGWIGYHRERVILTKWYRCWIMSVHKKNHVLSKMFFVMFVTATDTEILMPRFRNSSSFSGSF